ncbi:permease prefix domain 1-containing protein [Catellatospora bangladeshensis]|uniref:Uncharacterized protein n=1 Tax=Catellatospora bangladeshensis TaxID=310355 RepID=A0A8J3NKV2_9ACTN|nr:permease prefix domain 1-containing protein [Catellatospora bangladeshensis]GIF83398.1 hypothetical protein Cba03nite_47470 [Catellatospora bangladeshensis]
MTATLTDRYVTATVTRLPEARRADIERELRASIADAVDRRVDAGEDATAAEYAVLRDLGDPARLAAGYADSPQHLIGPAYFLDYTRLLKTLAAIVLPAVAGAVALAQVLGGAKVGTIIGTSISSVITTAMHLFFWVTIGFVAIERGGVRNPLTGQDWTPDALPDGTAPSRRARFGELIATTALSVVFVVALLISPYASPVRDAAGDPVGPLDPWLWDTGAVYAFAALVLIGLVTRYLRFYLRWQLSRALVILLVDLAGAAALIAAGATSHLLNPAFAEALGWAPVAVEWTHRGMMIAGVIVAITSLVEAYTDYRRRGVTAA